MARGTVTYRLVADASGVKKGVDEAKTALSSLPASMQNALRAGSSMVDDFANNAASKLGGAGQAMASLGPAGLAAAAGLGAMTAAFGGSIKAAVDYGAKISDLAGQTAMSAAALQKFDYAAKVTGTSLEAFTSASIKLSKALEDTPAKFAAIGVSARYLQTLAPEKQFEHVAEAIRKLESPTAQAAAALDIFGRGAASILPAIRQGVGALGDEAQRTGNVMSDEMIAATAKADDAFDRLGASSSAVVKVFGAFLVDGLKLDVVLTRVAEGVGKLVGKLNELANSRGASVLTEMMLRSPLGVNGPLGLLLYGTSGAGPSGGQSEMYPAVGTSAWRERHTQETVVDGTSALNALTAEQKRAADAAKKLTEAHIKLYSVGMSLADRVNAGIASANSWQRYTTEPLSLADRVNAGMNRPAEIPSAWGDRLGTSIADRVNAGMAKVFKPSMFEDLAKQLPQVIVGAIQGGGNIGGAIGGALGGGIGESLSKSLAPKLTGALGKTLGGALGAAMPVVGSLLGAGLGKLFGGLFGGPSEAEKKKAQQDEALKTYLPQLEQLSSQIDALIKQTMTAGAAGLGAMFAHLGDTTDLTADKLARMGAVGTSMFNALRAQGYSTLEAMKVMGPAISAAMKAAADAGLELSGTFKELADFQQRVADNESLIAAIDGATAAMNALALTGKLTQADFDTMQQAALDYFKQLEDAGFSAEQRLELMAPYLYAIAQAAEKYGFALDEALKKQIDLARDAGYFDEMQSPMEKLVELQGLMLLAIAALVKAFGKDLPEAVQKYIDKIKQIPVPPPPPGGGSGGNGEGETPDPGKGQTPGYATGGYIPATPGGKVIRVAEGGEGEYIVPESQMRGGGGGTQVIQLVVDGSVLAEATARTIERGSPGGRRLQRAQRRG